MNLRSLVIAVHNAIALDVVVSYKIIVIIISCALRIHVCSYDRQPVLLNCNPSKIHSRANANWFFAALEWWCASKRVKAQIQLSICAVFGCFDFVRFLVCVCVCVCGRCLALNYVRLTLKIKRFSMAVFGFAFYWMKTEVRGFFLHTFRGQSQTRYWLTAVITWIFFFLLRCHT